jgi:membrane protein implicated in regulation of membrane protease activity
MAWWAWIALGALLLAGEMLVPLDFWLVFLGLAALAVGVVDAAAPGLSVTTEWALFGVLSALSLLVFRRLVRARFTERPADVRVDDTLVGEAGRALEELAPGAIGPVELRGALWRGRNAGPAPIGPGARVRVERVEGLMLHVRAEA